MKVRVNYIAQRVAKDHAGCLFDGASQSPSDRALRLRNREALAMRGRAEIIPLARVAPEVLQRKRAADDGLSLQGFALILDARFGGQHAGQILLQRQFARDVFADRMNFDRRSRPRYRTELAILQSAIRNPHSAIKNGFRDFRRLRAVGAFEEDQYAKRNLFGSRRTDGAFLRRESDKPALRAPPDARSRGPCLAEDVTRQGAEAGLRRRAVFHRAAHPFDQRGAMFGRDVQPKPLLRDQFMTGRSLRAKKMAAVGQRGVGRDQLNRRDQQMIALAQRVARSPFAARQFARSLVRVHASLLAESESAQRRIERALAQPLAQAREKVVAGIGQGLRQAEWGIADWV